MVGMAKVLIFGDSQAAGPPGAATERALKAAGFQVRRFGNVGMGPLAYVQRSELWNQYVSAVRDFQPDYVVAMFGSNNVASASLEQAMARIRDGVRPPVFYSGPPAYPDATANQRGAAIRDLAKRVWGDARYIDAWPWTGGTAGRAADGLHFTVAGGDRWGLPLAEELVKRWTGASGPLPAGHPRAGGGGGLSSDRRPAARRGGNVAVAPKPAAAPAKPKKPK